MKFDLVFSNAVGNFKSKLGFWSNFFAWYEYKWIKGVQPSRDKGAEILIKMEIKAFSYFDDQ